jgi:hypothetical protein
VRDERRGRSEAARLCWWRAIWRRREREEGGGSVGRSEREERGGELGRAGGRRRRAEEDEGGEPAADLAKQEAAEAGEGRMRWAGSRSAGWRRRRREQGSRIGFRGGRGRRLLMEREVGLGGPTVHGLWAQFFFA